MTLNNGDIVQGEIRGGYENSVYVMGAGEIPRDQIKKVQHPTQMIFFGTLCLGTTLALMFAMVPSNLQERKLWNGWRMNYVFSVGMALSSGFIYGGLSVYDSSVDHYEERKKHSRTHAVAVPKILATDEYVVPGLGIAGEF